MAVLRFITMENGAQCVMMAGISMMLMWCVVSWASLVHPGLLMELNTVKDLVKPGWMKSDVKGERDRCYTVFTMAGEMRTVVIARMQV